MSISQLKDQTMDYPAALRSTFATFDQFCRYLSIGGMSLFLVMVLLSFCDVFLRYVFNTPLRGTVEITEFLMVVGVFSSVAFCQVNKSMVTMDIVTARLPKNILYPLEIITNLLSLGIMIACTYATARYALTCQIHSSIYDIPYRWFINFGTFGMGLLAAALLKDVVVSITMALRHASPLRVVCALAIGALLIAGCLWLITHRLTGWSPEALGGIALILLLVMFFLGVPVPYALLLSGFVFSCAIRGQAAGLSMFGKSWYNTVQSYNFSPLIFFMLMGNFCFYSKFGQDIYRCARERIGHLRGGLAMGTVVACALFGAVVGDVLPGSIAMAAIALPEMRKYNYDDGLAVGTLACAGTLGCLIPPSGSLIIYGILAEQSIGTLFMASVIPGLLCMVIFMITVWIMVFLKPELAPRLPKVEPKDRAPVLRNVLPVGAIFMLVIGGIYGGFFTPTEGGAVGATGVLILALLLRRLSWKELFGCLSDTAKYSSMSFAVLGAASALGVLMTLSRIPMFTANYIATLDVAPMLVMAVILLALIFLGCFIPAMPLMLICIPLFVPIANLFHWDLVWFGVIITIVFNIAAISPPFGISLFVMKAIADVPLGLMYRASIPFNIATVVCLILIVAFPALSLLLPMLMQ